VWSIKSTDYGHRAIIMPAQVDAGPDLAPSWWSFHG
jgi:hypothetical protein